ncbi:MAG: phosphoglucosamine mutase [Planctomycetota bacterium]
MTTSDEPIFGTDGVRGRALEGWLAPAAVEALGRTAGTVLWREHAADVQPMALIAHDGRASADALQSALARGLRAAGLQSSTAGLLPTPGLAWLTASRPVALGAMISASHNPAHDNGIKLFAGGGAKLTDAQQAEIEVRLREEVRNAATGVEPADGPTHDPSLEGAYVEHLVRLGSAVGAIDLGRVKVVLDCAHGAASRVGPEVLRSLGAETTVMHAAPDGSNINDGCGSTHAQALQRRVMEASADIGIALDGDADRCILVDESGALVDGDAIMTIVARDAAERGLWSDPRIVATVMSNRGLRRALEPVGVKVLEVGVGDRQVVEGLRREGLALGGEKSGHIVFGDENDYIGDGLLTALHVLGVVARSGAPLSQLAAPFSPFPQVLIGLEVASKPALETLERFQSLRAEFESELEPEGRVNVRYSGTEPKARIMVEGPDEARIGEIAQILSAALSEEIASR